MAGKSCLELRAKGGVTLEQAFERVGRAFRVSRDGAGQISETDRRKRERAKSAAKPAVRKTKAVRRPARKAMPPPSPVQVWAEVAEK